MTDADVERVESLLGHKLPAWLRERREMNEAEWLAEQHLFALTEFLRNRGEHRKLRLFAAACCRRVWDLLCRDAAKKVVELSEAYADGEATEAELRSALSDPQFDDLEIQEKGKAEPGTQLSVRVLSAIIAARLLADPYYERSCGAYIVAQETSFDPTSDFVYDPKVHGEGMYLPTDDAESAEQEKLLRDIIGNPFRLPAFDPGWRTQPTVGIASKMYKSRDYADMPVLADALEEAGCNDADIIAHCRKPAVHVRGCWVVDLVLGRV